jgi:AcrR family transcriptional regulator
VVFLCRVAGGRRTEPTTPRRAAIEASVLTATEELLREGASYSELNIERIATRAGLSRTAFYFYFRDKRDLLMRVTEGISGTLFGVADRWWSGNGDGRAELGEALAEITAIWREHLPLLRAIVEAASIDEEVATYWRGVLGRFVDATRDRIAAEQAAGLAPDGIPAAATAFTLCWATERALYQGLAMGAFTDESPPLDDAICSVWVGAIYGSR